MSDSSNLIISSARGEEITNCISFFNSLILDDLRHVPCWIAGGSVIDYFTNAGVIKNDVDVFFSISTYLYIALETLKEKGAVQTFENNRVINLDYKNHKIQLIKLYFTSPEDCIKSFDFTCCMAAVSREGFCRHDNFFDHNTRKKLFFNTLTYPLRTLYRVQKYASYGYKMSRTQLLRLVDALKAVDVTDTQQNDVLNYTQPEETNENPRPST